MSALILSAVHNANRRDFLRVAAAAAAAASIAGVSSGQASDASNDASSRNNAVQLSPLDVSTDASTEALVKSPRPFDGPAERVGFAVLGLGHLSLNQILPAFGKTRHCRPVALVSGDKAKAGKVAGQYGIKQSSIHNYENYDEIDRNPDVQVIYIVLQNSMHAEYVARGAKAGKHILCEKPMATSSADCERMISACKAARVQLMIAYRQQYEPMNRAILRLIRDGKLGPLRGNYDCASCQRRGVACSTIELSNLVGHASFV